MTSTGVLSLGLFALSVLSGCVTPPAPGTAAPRRGDEIVVAGQFFHTGTPVVLWMDPAGYDAYRVESRFGSFDQSDWETSKTLNKDLSTPNRYGLRRGLLSSNEIERVRGGGWDLPLLQGIVDQFVYHFDVAGTSEACFRTLHDVRCLSVHFMLDLDGTIYQTLDLKERAWHATSSNTRSIGIEIANVGAYPVGGPNPFGEWYRVETNGGPRITIPARFGDGGIRTPGFVGRPDRPQAVRGTLQGRSLEQYDFTAEQYAALTKLTAALCRIFPKLRCDYPRDAGNNLIPHKLSDPMLEQYAGLLGHYHIQENKIDPGPAFQWDRIVDGARSILEQENNRRDWHWRMREHTAAWERAR